MPRTDAPTPFGELATVPDPRSRHGQRHPLSAILGMVALAMPTGRTRLAGTARFGRRHGSALAAALGFTRAKTPSPSTLSRTLAALDADAVEAVLERLGVLPVAGKVVVGDAMFCRRDLAAKVVGEGGRRGRG